MDAPKRMNDYLESSSAKKICVEKQIAMPTKSIYYLCKAMSVHEKLCNEVFATLEMLKRHLRDTHCFSPRHIERYSAPINHCSAEFK